MPDTHAVVSTVLLCLSWPISKLASALAALVSPLYNAVHFMFLPCTYLVHAVFAILLFPFSLHVLERVETIYIYLGVAGLVGCLAGFSLFLIFRTLTSALGIDAASEANSKAFAPRARTAKEYRAARRKKQGKLLDSTEPFVASGAPKGIKGPRRRALMPQTIVEEEDSDF